MEWNARNQVDTGDFPNGWINFWSSGMSAETLACPVELFKLFFAWMEKDALAATSDLPRFATY